MWVVALDVLSVLILLAWGLFLLMVVAFIVMAVVELIRAVASVVAGAFRAARTVISRTDQEFLRHLGIRR